MVANAKGLTDDWLSANEAVRILTGQGQNPVDVKEMLADYLRDGLLKARAEAVWTTSELNLGKAWKTDEIAEDVRRDSPVPLQEWRTDKRAKADRDRWRWPYDKFFYTITSKPLKRRMFKGVRFSISDLAKLQPKAFLGVAPRTRGRKVDVARRDRGWLTVLELALGDRFHRGFFKDQNDLEQEMQNLLQDECGKLALGQNQIQEIARLVLPMVPTA